MAYIIKDQIIRKYIRSIPQVSSTKKQSSELPIVLAGILIVSTESTASFGIAI